MLSQFMEENGELTDKVLNNLLSADHLFAQQAEFKDILWRATASPPKNLVLQPQIMATIYSFMLKIYYICSASFSSLLILSAMCFCFHSRVKQLDYLSISHNVALCSLGLVYFFLNHCSVMVVKTCSCVQPVRKLASLG